MIYYPDKIGKKAIDWSNQTIARLLPGDNRIDSAPSPVEQRIPGPHPFNQPELVRYDEKALKRYSLFLTGQVATHVVSGMENPYKVDITSLKGLKGRR